MRLSRLTLATLPDTLTTDEVCGVLGVSRATWDRWGQRGIQPVPQMEPKTRVARYSKAAVQRYLDSRAQGTPMQRRWSA